MENAATDTSLASRLSPYLTTLRKAGARGLIFVGAGAVLSSIATAWAQSQALKADRTLPPEFVLELDLERIKISDPTVPSPLDFLQGRAAQIDLPRLAKALRHAKEDERVKGLVTYLGRRDNLGGLATAQEVSRLIGDFRRYAGTRAPTVAFGVSYGEAGDNGTVAYMVAAAHGAVYMQPSGLLGLNGLESRGFFLRGLLDRLKVNPIFFAREEYKTFANMFTANSFTEHHKANTTALLTDLGEQIIGSIAESRSLPSDAVAAAMDSAPLLPATSLAAKLIDGVKYRDEVQALFQASADTLKKEEALRTAQPHKHRRRKGDTSLRRVPVSRYLEVIALKEAVERRREAVGGSWLANTPLYALKLMWHGKLQEAVTQGDPAAPDHSQPLIGGEKKPRVAVVTVVGNIVQGPVPAPQAQNQRLIDATKLCRDLSKLAEDPDVAAVVLRINSPGGSAQASDTIHRELLRLRQAGKKLVVSMGDVAASGGYYMACAADKVVAMPGTLTGSIGVITGKFDVSELLSSAGINAKDAVEVGGNVGLLSPFTGLSQDQEAKVNTLIDSVYDDFIGKVSVGRGKSLSEVRDLAKGRVYTGHQAQQVGLVDTLGGLQEAVELAKKEAGLPLEPSKTVVHDYPVRKVPLLLQLIQRSGMAPDRDEQASASTSTTTSASLASALLAGEVGQSLLTAAAAALLSAHTPPALSAPSVATTLQAVGTNPAAGGGAWGAGLLQSIACVLDGEVKAYSLEADMLSRVC